MAQMHQLPFHILFVIWTMWTRKLLCWSSLYLTYFNQNMWKPTPPKSGDFISSLTSKSSRHRIRTCLQKHTVNFYRPLQSIENSLELTLGFVWKWGSNMLPKWQYVRPEHDDEPSVLDGLRGYSTRFSDPKPNSDLETLHGPEWTQLTVPSGNLT